MGRLVEVWDLGRLAGVRDLGRLVGRLVGVQDLGGRRVGVRDLGRLVEVRELGCCLTLGNGRQGVRWGMSTMRLLSGIRRRREGGRGKTASCYFLSRFLYLQLWNVFAGVMLGK